MVAMVRALIALHQTTQCNMKSATGVSSANSFKGETAHL